MKKVIILAYFYPPSNFVGGERPESWTKYLPKHDIYPIIITRNWNPGQKELTDSLFSNELVHEIHEHFEIYRLPYKRSLRDRLHFKKTNVFITLLRKSLSLVELIGSNFFLQAIPYANFYSFTKKLIEKNPGAYSLLIASGRPFQSFFIADQLHKTTAIPWIADYRDEWNTRSTNIPKTALEKVIKFIETKSEKRWLQSAETFLSVSNEWVQNISALINKKGHRVMNGFDASNEHHAAIKTTPNNAKFILSYSGTLYPYQEIEKTIDLVKKLSVKYQSSINIELYFIGIDIMPDQKKRVQQLIKGYESNFIIIDKVPKAELYRYLEQSDVLVATGYDNLKGVYPVKIFEYINFDIPILLYPSDQSTIEALIKTTNSGEAVSQSEQAYNLLDQWITNKLNAKLTVYERNKSEVKKYTREMQASILADIINHL